MEKKKAGRPKGSKNKVSKNKTIIFRIEENKLEALEKLAQAYGAGTASIYTRDIIERVINAGAPIYRKDNNEA